MCIQLLQESLSPAVLVADFVDGPVRTALHLALITLPICFRLQ